jgi:hypothetical protein
MLSYKIFHSAEFVNRITEIERAQKILSEKNKVAMIFEGERGEGKSSLMFELFRRFQQQSDLQPFLISLSPYSAPELEENKNTWINSDREFQTQDIPNLLNQLAHYLQIDFIKSQDRDVQKEYLARGLAYRSSKTVPVLLVDSVYECSENTRIEIEKYVLAPILTSERVFIVLSGRGKRPAWSRPELQNAEIIPLHPLNEEYVKEQLDKMKSHRASEYKSIKELSGGYPLVVRVIGESEKKLPEALNDAIDIVINDILPEPEKEEKKYSEIRIQLEKLSLVNIPYRIPDVEEYLYPDDIEKRSKTDKLLNLFKTIHILRYEGKGNQLNRSITHPILKWLMLPQQQSRCYKYLAQLDRVSRNLQEDYPSAKQWYQGMLPEGLSVNNISIPPHQPRAHDSA